jgi:hypothetical protein
MMAFSRSIIKLHLPYSILMVGGDNVSVVLDYQRYWDDTTETEYIAKMEATNGALLFTLIVGIIE